MDTITEEKPNFNNIYICNATNSNTRYKSTSGGFISSTLQFLFERNFIDTAINYELINLKYTQKLIYNFKDYKNVGSIYHETQNITFIKKNINNIGNSIAVVCLPCEVKAIRKLLTKNNIKSYIFSLTCSTQLSYEATDYLFEKLSINKLDISSFQYRGNGWPSGIQIKLKDNNQLFVQNYPSIWSDIFHSLIFSHKKCLNCKDTFGINADFIVADPWIKEYVEKDTKGYSVVVVNERVENIFNKLLNDNIIIVKENIKSDILIQSQKYTLQKKYITRKYKILFKYIRKVITSDFYKKIVFGKFTNSHNKILKFIFRVLLKIERIKGNL